MIALIKQTIKKSIKGTGITIAISIIFVWMFVAMYPSFKDQADKFAEVMDAYPTAFIEAFGIEPEGLFSSVEAFMAAEHFSLMWPIMILVIVVAFASGAIAGEIEKGTIEILLAQPISRLKLYWGKFISGMFSLLLFVLISNSSIIVFSILYGVEYQLSNLALISVVGFLFGFAIYGLTFLFSSILSTRGVTSSMSAGIVLIMYGLNIVAKLQESLESLKYISFFHYYDFNQAVVHNEIALENIVVLLGVGIIASLFGFYFFEKRDIAT